jgi:predicted permease
MRNRSVSYIVLFGLFGNILRWSYGYSLLTEETTSYDIDKSITMDYSYGTRQIGSQIAGSTISALEANLQSAPTEDTQLLDTNQITYTNAHWLSRLRELGKNIYSSMTRPLSAALLALAVAFIPDLQRILFAKDSFLYGAIIIGLENCGSASVPLVLVCLGAQLSTISFERDNSRSENVVSMAVLCRMVVCPLITIPLVTAIHYFGQSTIGLAADPAFFVVIGLLSAMPTAISLTQIAQVGRGESLLLRALFWGYGVLCLPFCTLTVLSLLAILDWIR